MSAELVMAGPGQPITHDSHHDLESLFYVLVGLCVLLDEPFKYKSDGNLSQCFDKYFNTFEPSVLKTITIQSDLTWLPMILARLSPYFQPLIPLLTRLREDVILPMHTDSKGNFCRKKPLTHKVLIDAVIDSLLALDDDAWRPYNCSGAGVGGWNECLLGNETSDGDESEEDSENGSILVEEGSELKASEGIAALAGLANSPKNDCNESRSATPPVAHNAIKWQVVCPPPNTNRLSTSEPSHGVLSDSFMRVRRRAPDDPPDHCSNPRVKRARSSTKNVNDPAASSARPYRVMPIKSTSSAPRRSTRVGNRRTDRSR